MKIVVGTLLAVAFVITNTKSSPVQNCSGGLQEHPDNYKISDCERAPCRLRKNSNIELEFKFTSDVDAPSLKNNVYAKIVGIPFPFIGVDGTDACPQIYLPDGSKAGCPLKAGQDYVYKNSFKVLEIYPKLKVLVHWALTAPGNKDLLCFNVPARITS